MERGSQVLSTDDMKAASKLAACDRARMGGAEVHEVTHVSDPIVVGAGLWRVTVRVLMEDGAVRIFCCDSTARDVFTVREIPDA
jgi:hypothetical protein